MLWLCIITFMVIFLGPSHSTRTHYHLIIRQLKVKSFPQRPVEIKVQETHSARTDGAQTYLLRNRKVLNYLQHLFTRKPTVCCYYQLKCPIKLLKPNLGSMLDVVSFQIHDWLAVMLNLRNEVHFYRYPPFPHHSLVPLSPILKRVMLSPRQPLKPTI